MPTWGVILIVLLVTLTDVVIFAAVGLGVRAAWRPLPRDFPPIDPLPGAVTRRFQSFKFGVVNLGWSIHVSVDESRLHLRPTRLARLLGISAASVPWEEVHVLGGRGRVRKARVGALKLLGPAWCFELAEVGAPSRD